MTASNKDFAHLVHAAPQKDMERPGTEQSFGARSSMPCNCTLSQKLQRQWPAKADKHTNRLTREFKTTSSSIACDIARARPCTLFRYFPHLS
eukprot:3890713-Pyramimonas_sp.AAC.1